MLDGNIIVAPPDQIQPFPGAHSVFTDRHHFSHFGQHPDEHMPALPPVLETTHELSGEEGSDNEMEDNRSDDDDDHNTKWEYHNLWAFVLKQTDRVLWILGFLSSFTLHMRVYIFSDYS